MPVKNHCMNYLKIRNKGLLDVEALTLLGASSKREDETKIGMFGSGNKYALAYLLRNNYEVRIYSGLNEIVLSLVEKKFRDKVFHVIVINGAETSITTEFGKDWQLWQAIRELYCNAIDEGGQILEYVHHPQPEEGATCFYIKTRAEITNFVGDFDNYFSENRKVLFENAYGKILEKTEGAKLNLYRKGIRCMETDRTSVYDYDLANIDIDENRLVKYHWDVASQIWNLIYQCTDKEVIRNILFNCSKDNNIECIAADFHSVNGSYMSDAYTEVIKELSMAPIGLSGLLTPDEIGQTTVLPNIIFNQVKAVVGNDSLATRFKVYKGSFYIEVDMDALNKATLDKCYEFLKECNYTGPMDYPVAIARFDDKRYLGFADQDGKRIILSEVCMAKGVQAITETLIEEFIHLKYDVKDQTRGFQDAAITEIVSLLKVKNAMVV